MTGGASPIFAFLFTGLFCPMTGGAYLIFAFSFTGLFDPLTGGASLIFAFCSQDYLILSQVAHTQFSFFLVFFLFFFTLQ